MTCLEKATTLYVLFVGIIFLTCIDEEGAASITRFCLPIGGNFSQSLLRQNPEVLFAIIFSSINVAMWLLSIAVFHISARQCQCTTIMAPGLNAHAVPAGPAPAG